MTKDLQNGSIGIEDVAESNARKSRLVRTREMIGSDEQTFPKKLRCTHGTRRIDRLVAARHDHALHVGGDSCLNHVVGTDDVRLHGLERVVLRQINVFQSGAMEHDLHTVHGSAKAIPVPHIPQKHS